MSMENSNDTIVKRRVRIKIGDQSVEPRPGPDRSVQLLVPSDQFLAKWHLRVTSLENKLLRLLKIVPEIQLNHFALCIESFFLGIRLSGLGLSSIREAPGSKPDRSYSNILFLFLVNWTGRDDITTRYKLENLCFESRRRRVFLEPSRPAMRSTQPPLQ
jgi:hypothetical protein